MNLDDLDIEDVIRSIAPDGIFIYFNKSRNLKHLREKFNLNAKEYFQLYNVLLHAGIKEQTTIKCITKTMDEQEILDHYKISSLEELDTH